MSLAHFEFALHVVMTPLSHSACRDHLSPILLSLGVQVSCLLELLELDLIHEAEKHVAHLHHLLLSEKQRDDSTLPLDLWKKNVSFGTSHVCDFILLV